MDSGNFHHRLRRPLSLYDGQTGKGVKVDSLFAHSRYKSVFSNEALALFTKSDGSKLCKVTKNSYLGFLSLTGATVRANILIRKCWNVTGSAGLTNSI